ncbi:MAG: exodeoxyribonuclease III [Christensenellaceae bacterium]|jgi:exodeoxyribonuclease-3|nr:exodeoxyribonuclease III [Christensenellaceae bacterium]
MKFVSWNVNGFRACLQKGFAEYFAQAGADWFCLQETKMQPDQADFAPEGYHVFYHSAVRKGYSGTAIFARRAPLGIAYGIDGQHDDEGRVITLEYEAFYLITCYSPNAQAELARLGYRMEFEEDLRAYLTRLNQHKPVILCGDLNVAHADIDLKNPGPNRGSAGFTDEEREAFTRLLAAGFVDSYRHLYPAQTGAYTWWSYRFNARANNAGWRIDYFVMSNALAPALREVRLRADVPGSDHCPVELELEG